jgi:hypothetical protein
MEKSYFMLGIWALITCVIVGFVFTLVGGLLLDRVLQGFHPIILMRPVLQIPVKVKSNIT